MTQEEHDNIIADYIAQINDLNQKIDELNGEKDELNNSLNLSREANDKLLKLIPMNDSSNKEVEEPPIEELISEYLKSKGVN